MNVDVCGYHVGDWFIVWFVAVVAWIQTNCVPRENVCHNSWSWAREWDLFGACESSSRKRSYARTRTHEYNRRAMAGACTKQIQDRGRMHRFCATQVHGWAAAEVGWSFLRARDWVGARSMHQGSVLEWVVHAPHAYRYTERLGLPDRATLDAKEVHANKRAANAPEYLAYENDASGSCKSFESPPPPPLPSPSSGRCCGGGSLSEMRTGSFLWQSVRVCMCLYTFAWTRSSVCARLEERDWL